MTTFLVILSVLTLSTVLADLILQIANRNALAELSAQLDRIENKMAINQATFDTDLAALMGAIGTLVTAVDALLASTPAVDLTDEDKSVQAAAASVAAELNKLNPPTPVPTPAPVPTA